jgi:hypothetical protein
MIYKNFDGHITRKHGIVIEGWPLRAFDNPSAIGSQVELNVLSTQVEHTIKGDTPTCIVNTI